MFVDLCLNYKERGFIGFGKGRGENFACDIVSIFFEILSMSEMNLHPFFEKTYPVIP
jgi:hypothetical protein